MACSVAPVQHATDENSTSISHVHIETNGGPAHTTSFYASCVGSSPSAYDAQAARRMALLAADGRGSGAGGGR